MKFKAKYKVPHWVRAVPEVDAMGDKWIEKSLGLRVDKPEDAVGSLQGAAVSRSVCKQHGVQVTIR